MNELYRQVEEFIAILRDSFIGSQQVYTEGSCYQFYLILKNVFPMAEAYYDTFHVITKIEERYYDITGEVCWSNNMVKMENVADYGLKVPFNIYKINK